MKELYITGSFLEFLSTFVTHFQLPKHQCYAPKLKCGRCISIEIGSHIAVIAMDNR